jgi:hypothetical protein
MIEIIQSSYSTRLQWDILGYFASIGTMMNILVQVEWLDFIERWARGRARERITILTMFFFFHYLICVKSTRRMGRNMYIHNCRKEKHGEDGWKLSLVCLVFLSHPKEIQEKKTKKKYT